VAARAEVAEVSGRGGFTIVEVIVATIVLAAGLLGLAGATAHVVRQVTLAGLMTERAYAVQTVVERVQATSYASVASGADSVGLFDLHWSSVPESGVSKIVTVVTTGPGLTSTSSGSFPYLGPNVVDTFAFRVISR
jgi:Tfp pilus assembly protein PilV